MKRSSIPPETLDKYLNGTCTQAERDQVENWYQSFDNNPDLEKIFPESKSETYAKSIFEKIHSQIKLQSSDRKPARMVHLRKQWHLYLAASIVIALGVSFLFRSGSSLTRYEQLAKKANPVKYLINKTSQIALQQLPDSSKVWLNPGSSISYSDAYGKKVREIRLEGEAFFDVVRNTGKPFIIRTGKMTTEVLGTSFNVQARKDSKQFEVSVVSGTVAVSGPEGKKIIKAKQQVQFDCLSGKLNEFKRPAAAPFQIWEPVTINFDWASVNDVTNSLEEMFAVQVEFENDAIKNCFLRADFTNLRLPVIMDILCQSIGATYTINNGTIRLSGGGCE